ncbi:MAG: hypothetical protein GY841_16005 [FCB group bacterium]|nr:hypothetical protein [FCB group bacterium]
MISIDSHITAFVANNLLTIGLVVLFIKRLAEITPFEWDNKIADLISGMAEALTKRNGK